MARSQDIVKYPLASHSLDSFASLLLQPSKHSEYPQSLLWTFSTPRLSPIFGPFFHFMIEKVKIRKSEIQINLLIRRPIFRSYLCLCFMLLVSGWENEQHLILIHKQKMKFLRVHFTFEGD